MVKIIDLLTFPGKAIIILFGIEIKPADMAIFPHTPPTVSTYISVPVIFVHIEIVQPFFPLETAVE